MTLFKRVLCVSAILGLPLLGGCMAAAMLVGTGAGITAISKHDEQAAKNAQFCQAVTQKAVNEGLDRDGLRARLKAANCPS